MPEKPKWMPFLCQCKDCLEMFSIDAMVNGGHIVRLDEHPRVGCNGDGGYYHRCGGNGQMRGRLVLYPTLKRRG